ncbi:MAG: hypothetical protein ACJA2W_003719 [Planctomycetota bacterium]|jgi:hypothetical protein
MKTTLFLSLALALPMISSCGEAVDAASGAGDAAAAAAKGAADKAGDVAGDMMSGLKDFDISGLSMDAVKAKAAEVTSSMTEKLSSIKDVATAENFKKTFDGSIEKLGEMKKMLGANLPGTDALMDAINKVKTSFGADTKVMEVLKPLMDKMSGLFS